MHDATELPRNSYGFAAAVLAVSFASVGGCKERPDPSPTSAPTTSQTDAARIDVENPKAGMNTSRPDSMKDVKPGTP